MFACRQAWRREACGGLDEGSQQKVEVHTNTDVLGGFVCEIRHYYFAMEGHLSEYIFNARM